MQWRKFPLTIFLLALAAFFVLRFEKNSRDPIIQGKRLSNWIHEFDIWQGPTANAARTVEGSGESAEKLLIGMLRSRDSIITLKVREFLSKQHWLKVDLASAASLHERALNTCNLLGERVGGTAPAIAALVTDYPRREVSSKVALHALNTLAAMGTNGVHGLVEVLAHRDPSLRIHAAQLLGAMRDSGSVEVIRALEALSRDSNPAVTNAVVSSLELLKNPRIFPVRSSDAIRPDGGLDENSASVWDMTRGTRIVSNSGLYPGCRPEDLFGARLSSVGTPETGSAIFADSAPDGFVHSIEWETSSPVTLQSFGLIGAHEAALCEYIRAFRGFRLFARGEGDERYTLFYEEGVPVPYGSGYCGSLLVRFRNLPAPVTARYFRVEFVQNGTGAFHGARAIELYGFNAPLSSSLVNRALENQEPAVRDGVRAVLENETSAAPRPVRNPTSPTDRSPARRYR